MTVATGPPLILAGVLDPLEAANLAAAMLTATNDPAWVAGTDGSGVDTKFRKTRVVRLDPQLASAVSERFLSFGPELARHFGVALGSAEAPQFLRYDVGDFFTAHADRSQGAYGPDTNQRRSVSASLIVNPHDEWTGGDLVLYTDSTKTAYYPLDAEPGMLVAFASTTMHEVTEITSGHRFSVVTWWAEG